MTWLDGFFVLLSIGWVYEIWRYRNRSDASDASSERQSFYVVAMTMGLTLAVSVVYASVTSFTPSPLQQMSGLLLYALGITFRYWGILHLRHQFTRHVVVRESDQLVSTGPYRFLRHPLYTGLLLITLGFALYCLPILPALVGAGVTALALLRRIRIEESMLTSHFGPSYETWKKSRKRLLPFIY